MRIQTIAVSLAVAAALAACGDDNNEKASCDPADIASCGAGKICQAAEGGGGQCVAGCSVDHANTCLYFQACEEVEGGTRACFAPYIIEGTVTNAINGTPVAGARIAARDSSGGVVGEVAESRTDGAYFLRVPMTRKADGSAVPATFTLRADAAGFATFPGELRPALPIETGATRSVKSAATNVALLPLASTAGLGIIRGTVQAPSPAGTLVVASDANGLGASGVADRTGEFVVFNAPAGANTVRGYLKGVQLAPAQATVPAGGEVGGVVLARQEGKPLATISGNVNIVNAPGGSLTSIVLVAEETFIEALEIGEVPRGLRATGVSGAWSIAEVPDGRYVVLASMDNDGLVRDPDPNISGTQLVRLTVTDGVPSPATLPSFKITEALTVRSPGATTIEEVSGTPIFTWADDSSEDAYALKVFDALGNLIWENPAIPGVSGAVDVSQTYAGPALTAGMIYQFRVTSLKTGAPISRTEELKGVFLFK